MRMGAGSLRRRNRRYCPTGWRRRQSPSEDRGRLSGRRVEAWRMDPLNALLIELEQFGRANDGSTTERPRRMLNITRDTGELLAVLVRATMARRVLEIGTSNGYSTLWLASAARAIGGGGDTGGPSHHKGGAGPPHFASFRGHPHLLLA